MDDATAMPNLDRDRLVARLNEHAVVGTRSSTSPKKPATGSETGNNAQTAVSTVEVWDELPSTNTYLADRFAAHPADLVDGTLVVARHQSAGLGRRGRTWQTPPDAALTMSLLVDIDQIAPADRPLLSLAAGLAIVRCLSDSHKVSAAIKWPNDVVAQQPDSVELESWGHWRKLAGVLTQVATTGSRTVAIIGMGLNVRFGISQLPVPHATALTLLRSAEPNLEPNLVAGSAAEPAAGTAAGTAAEAGTSGTDAGPTTDAPIDQTELAADIIARLCDYISALCHGAAEQLVQSVQDVSMMVGRNVRVELANNEVLEGFASGLGAGGELLVRDHFGVEHAVIEGDVTQARAGSDNVA